jgi:hypothetical protein
MVTGTNPERSGGFAEAGVVNKKKEKKENPQKIKIFLKCTKIWQNIEN